MEAIAAIRRSGAEPFSGLLPAFLPQSRTRTRRRTAGARAARGQHFQIERRAPQIKEYKQVSTTIVNAYVAGAAHLANLEQRLAEAGFKRLLSSSSCRMAAWRRWEPRGWPRARCCRPRRGVSGARRGAAIMWCRSTWAAHLPISRSLWRRDTADRQCSPASASRCAVSTSRASRPAAARSRGLTPAARCAPGQSGLGAGAGVLRQWWRDRHLTNANLRRLSRRLPSMAASRRSIAAATEAARRPDRGLPEAVATKPPPAFSA